MKNIDLIKIYEQLDNAVTSCTAVFPVPVAFKIVSNKQKIKEAAQAYIDMRDALIMKYAEGQDHISEGMRGYIPFQKEYRELNNIDVDIYFNKITLADIENAQLPLNVLDCIYPMIGD